MQYARHLFVVLALFMGGLVESITGLVSTYTSGLSPVSYEQEMKSSMNQFSEVLAVYEHKLSRLEVRAEEFGGLTGQPIGFDAPESVGGMDQEMDTMVPDLAKRLLDFDEQINEADRRSAAISRRQGQIVTRVANAIRGFPVEQGFISSPFGVRKDPFGYKMVKHKGLDIAADPGAEVFATAPGTVYAAARMGGFGNAVIISHDPGGVQTIYAHLGEISVTKGMKVKRGEVLGSVGSSGRSTGPHIHYEIRLANNSIDPLPFLYR